ncbi:hypothetical protein [Kitasatospora purpeofusca]|uniref:hypothetical protein n=1 Tax=Kitasatospora purpeofusca TaxID=67352 RepID=UPI00224F4DAF|nr:hypothetical protein [Kitasatospora purpeofusca]MCX4755555.1 hypothetical protein [Kitasatospora purpeofusca]WSR36578.1 hypothetical protein OG715_39840 [Kitasatospora purpeofusca]
MTEWAGVSKLSLMLETGGPGAEIYANGRNQIAVTVSVKPTDENGSTYYGDISWPNRVNLVDYVSGEKLNWQGREGWCFTDREDRYFHHLPGGGSRAAAETEPEPAAEPEAELADDGTQKFTFYISCWPGADRKSVSAWVETDTGKVYTTTAGSGSFEGKVALDPLVALTHRRSGVNWEYSRTATRYENDTKYVSTEAWNYYLSLDSTDNYFVTFSVSGYWSDPGYEGFFACDIKPDSHHKNLYGSYVWYQEPHGSSYDGDGGYGGLIVNFPDGNKWWDYARVYDRPYPEQYLCFTWVHATTGGDGWHIPNGPVNTWRVYFSPVITAWDRYGNTGKFSIDGSGVDSGIELADYS